MNVAAIFVVEAHLSELREEAMARRYASRPNRPSRFQRLLSAIRASAAAPREPVVPTLESYPS